MHHSYCDIRNRIGEEPTWWDENAVPRYQPFRPQECANIHAVEAALVLITCQDCGKEYRVAFTLSERRITERGETWAAVVYQIADAETITGAELRRRLQNAFEKAWAQTLADEIRERTLRYGDPPNACDKTCTAGATMNSEPRRVLEYWRRYRRDVTSKVALLDWERDSSLEIEIEPDWVSERR